MTVHDACMSNKNRDYRLNRQEIYERDGHRCVYCGTTKYLTLDHLIPISKGGDYFSSDNLVTACLHCNNAKGCMDPLEWLVGKHQILRNRRTNLYKKAS